MKLFKTGYCILITIIFIAHTNAQNVQWAHKGTSQGYEYGNSVATDDSGNVYVTGQIEYTTRFDNGQNIKSRGSHDIFAAKYAPDGTLIWVQSAGGVGGDVGYGIAVDAMHNCYVTGEMEKVCYFSPTDSLTSNGGNDIFISKYDSNGQFLWAKSFGSTESDKGYSLITNSNGDVFLTGFYSAHIYFDNIHLSPGGYADIYTMKLTSDGDVQWVKRAIGAGHEKGKGITYDQSGNLYVAGYFSGQTNFSGTTINNNSVTGGYLVKYDPNGQLIWVKGNCCGESYYESLGIDSDGFLYAAGNFKGTVNIAGTTLTASGNTDILIVKYDSLGNIVWAKKAGGPLEDNASGITVDSVSQMFYITGLVDDHGYFDSFYVSTAGNRDVFIAAYNFNGDCQWVKSYGGTDRDIANGISSDRNGNIVTTGTFVGNATFGSFSLSGNLLTDLYVNKVNPIAVAAPTITSSNLFLTDTNCTDLSLNFTAGNGSGRIIIAHEGSPVNELPLNGIMYTGNSVYGIGADLGNGNFVVYRGTDISVNVTGLSSGVEYYFSVFEYNGSGAVISYLTNNPAIASQMIVTPSVSIMSASNAICVGDSLMLSAIGGVSHNWSPSTGLSATTGNVVIASPDTTTDYIVTANSNGCIIQSMKTITVHQLPATTLALNDSICENESPVQLTGGSPSGGLYFGTGVNMGTFDPAISGPGAIAINYFYTDANGCSAISTDSINVLPLPLVTLSLQNNICENENPVILSGGSPSGGIYSGRGVAGNLFIPSVAGIGIAPVLYSYTDVSGCYNSASSSITVNEAPVVSIGNDTTLCAGSSILLNAGNAFSHYLWSTGSVQSVVTIDSSGVGIASTDIFVEVGNSFGCFITDTVQITFAICSGIENGNNYDALSFYPNPFANTFHLSLDLRSDIYICDSTGRLVEKFGQKNGEVVLGADLAPGIYSVMVSCKDTVKILRVVKSAGN